MRAARYGTLAVRSFICLYAPLHPAADRGDPAQLADPMPRTFV